MENNAYTELGHELRHSYDYDQGNFKDIMFKFEYERFKDPAEKRAVGFENLIRKSFKLDLRMKYGENNKIKYTNNEDL